MYTKAQLEELQFHHFVVANSEGIIFASCRCNGKVENFIIDPAGRWVKQQVANHFEYLPSELADSIRIKADFAYGKVPVYRVPTFNFS